MWLSMAPRRMISLCPGEYLAAFSNRFAMTLANNRESTFTMGRFSSLSNHRVRVECEENLPMVKVDSRLLASVIANLLENAAKYSPGQSEIILRGAIDSHILKVTVQDQGPGIPTKELTRVFDKFYRGAIRSVKRRYGTGMGLAIARGKIGRASCRERV